MMTDRLTMTLVRVLKAAILLIIFINELIKSSVRVARAVLSPGIQAQPGIIAVPLSVKTDAGITTLANLVSLTPGSLSLDVSEDRKTLFVHVMFIGDADAERQGIKDSLERPVEEVFG